MEFITTIITWRKGGNCMKRLWKILLILGIICVVVGGIFSGILGFCFFDEIVAHKEYFISNNYVSFLDNFRGRDGFYYNASECKESYYDEIAKEEIQDICFEFAVCSKITITCRRL